jgi:hypothetical protein
MSRICTSRASILFAEAASFVAEQMPQVHIADPSALCSSCAGMVRQPYGTWMAEAARNLTDGVDGILFGKQRSAHLWFAFDGPATASSARSSSVSAIEPAAMLSSR